MSDLRNIESKFLSDSRLRRDSHRQDFSRLSADNGMLASPNDHAGTRYRLLDCTHNISAVGGHSTAMAGGTAYPSTIHTRNPLLAPSKYTNIRDPQIVASSMEMSPPSLMQGPATSNPFAFHRRDPPLTLCTYTDIRRPSITVPSMDRRILPLTPPAYIDIRDPPMAAPPPTEMSSPSHGPAAGQSPTTSDPSIPRLNPSSTQFSDPTGRRFRCECSYETIRKCDFDRHRESIHHEGKRHYCPFPNCTKSYTRKYTLEKHESTHFNNH